MVKGSLPVVILGVFVSTLILSSCGGGGGGGSSSTGATGGSTNGSTTETTGSTASTTGVTTSTTSTTGSTTSSTTGSTTSSTAGQPDLGIGANMNGYRPFPDDNPWNTPVDQEPVDPNSANIIASIGLTKNLHPDFGANWNGGPFGIPYVVVDGNQPRVPMTFDYDDESDPGPYPIPPNAPIEGGPSSDGDRHILVIDRDNKELWETFYSFPNGGGWHCGSGAKFNLNLNALRPAGWTSADAAGLPIFPGLVRYDEVVLNGEINHAIRFTVSRSRRAYISPARHWASSSTDVNRPPMGMRVRLKASFNMSGYPESAQVILRALKKYGMIVADNGSDWYMSGAPDARWSDSELNTLKQVKGSDFEVVKMGPITQ